ncbi:DoxX family protein [Caenispirillum bisanense]|uniref:DoxX family protein n=1 Tax=Caenispirillum bisanense TaxID=414052 RepID=UPI0031D9CC40
MTDTRLAPYAALLLRLTLGVTILAHGLLKVVVFTPAGTAQYFGSLGLPAAAAYLVIFAEVAGGIALILGLWTRLAALLLVPVLLGALWVHAGNGWVFSAEGGGWEFPAFWTMTLLVQALLGDGAHAVRTPVRLLDLGAART